MACPGRQLSFRSYQWVTITPLGAAVTTTIYARYCSDKSSQPPGAAPSDCNGATLRSGCKGKTADDSIGDRCDPSLSGRTPNTQTAGAIRDPDSSCLSKPSSEQGLQARGAVTPLSFAKEKPLLGEPGLYCWKLAAPPCVPVGQVPQRP